MALAPRELGAWAARPRPSPSHPAQGRGRCSGVSGRLLGCSDLMMKAPLVSRSFRSLLKRLSRLIMNL